VYKNEWRVNVPTTGATCGMKTEHATLICISPTKNLSCHRALFELVTSRRIQSPLSFHASLFTNVPVEEAVQVIGNGPHNYDTLAERPASQAEAVMELLREVCLRSIYFQVDEKFLQQKDGMAMGSSLS
jgi:hypothetical protein